MDYRFPNKPERDKLWEKAFFIAQILTVNSIISVLSGLLSLLIFEGLKLGAYILFFVIAFSISTVSTYITYIQNRKDDDKSKVHILPSDEGKVGPI